MAQSQEEIELLTWATAHAPYGCVQSGRVLDIMRELAAWRELDLLPRGCDVQTAYGREFRRMRRWAAATLVDVQNAYKRATGKDITVCELSRVECGEFPPFSPTVTAQLMTELAVPEEGRHALTRLSMYRPPATLDPHDVNKHVLHDFAQRRAFGLDKYGKTVDPNDPGEDWLQHAYEECLDQAVYLKAEIMRRANAASQNPPDGPAPGDPPPIADGNPGGD